MPLYNPPVQIQDEGTDQGSISKVNFVGTAITTTVAGDTATVTVSGGGAGVKEETHIVLIAVGTEVTF